MLDQLKIPFTGGGQDDAPLGLTELRRPRDLAPAMWIEAESHHCQFLSDLCCTSRIFTQAVFSLKRGSIRHLFLNKPIAPGILSLPELADGFGCFIQPIAIRQQRHEFDSTEKLYCVRVCLPPMSGMRLEHKEKVLPNHLQIFGFHDCRHYFISYAVMSGIDFMTIARWVGHKDSGILIGKVYGHLINEHAQLQATRMNFGPAIEIGR